MPLRRLLVPKTRAASHAPPNGGLLVVSGLPLGGKVPLAAKLSELMPGCVGLHAIDNLSFERQIYSPVYGGNAVLGDVEAAILQDAEACWREAKTATLLIIACARFSTRGLRRKAADSALTAGKPFLLIEAHSPPIRSLRRVSHLELSARETAARVARYDQARRTYQAISNTERAELPAMSFSSVLSHLDDVAARVLTAWYGWKVAHSFEEGILRASSSWNGSACRG